MPVYRVSTIVEATVIIEADSAEEAKTMAYEEFDSFKVRYDDGSDDGCICHVRHLYNSEAELMDDEEEEKVEIITDCLEKGDKLKLLTLYNLTPEQGKEYLEKVLGGLPVELTERKDR